MVPSPPTASTYLLATSAGLARYRTQPVAFDRNIGPSGEVTHLAVAPTGTRVHAMGPHGRAVVDWQSGAIISVECCDAPEVHFTPDGSVRFQHLRSQTTGFVRVTAFAESAGTLLWEHEVPYYDCGPGAASSSYFALNCFDWDEPVIYFWNVVTGAEHFLSVCCGSGLAWHGERLLISHGNFDWTATRLSAYDLQAGTMTVVAERAEDPLRVHGG